MIDIDWSQIGYSQKLLDVNLNDSDKEYWIDKFQNGVEKNWYKNIEISKHRPLQNHIYFGDFGVTVTPKITLDELIVEKIIDKYPKIALKSSIKDLSNDASLNGIFQDLFYNQEYLQAIAANNNVDGSILA